MRAGGSGGDACGVVPAVVVVVTCGQERVGRVHEIEGGRGVAGGQGSLGTSVASPFRVPPQICPRYPASRKGFWCEKSYQLSNVECALSASAVSALEIMPTLRSAASLSGCCFGVMLR